jgi:hypothetical protein
VTQRPGTMLLETKWQKVDGILPNKILVEDTATRARSITFAKSLRFRISSLRYVCSRFRSKNLTIRVPEREHGSRPKRNLISSGFWFRSFRTIPPIVVTLKVCASLEDLRCAHKGLGFAWQDTLMPIVPGTQRPNRIGSVGFPCRH